MSLKKIFQGLSEGICNKAKGVCGKVSQSESVTIQKGRKMTKENEKKQTYFGIMYGSSFNVFQSERDYAGRR